MTATNSSGSHKHDLPATVDAALASIAGKATIDHVHPEVPHTHPEIDALAARIAVLENPAPPFTADYHVSPAGIDASDGSERAPWRTLGKAFASAPPGSAVALWGGGPIDGGALYDRALHLVTAPGVNATIQGPGRYSLRLQRAHGTAILPGAGGSISILPPRTIAEPPAADGSDAGTVRQAAVELTDCNDLDLDLHVTAGTDFGILASGTTLRSKVRAHVTDAGIGVMLKGNLGTGADRSWFSGVAEGLHRMVRNTRTAGDDYGAVGFVFENSTGGGLRDWSARDCWSESFDYVADGGGAELYDASDAIIEAGTITDCECGIETGGSAGKGCHRNTITGLRLVGSMGPGTAAAGVAARSPGILIRNFEASTLDFHADVTRARVVLEVYADAGTFGGSIANSRITGTIVQRPGVTPTSLRDVPATTTVAVSVVQP